MAASPDRSICGTRRSSAATSSWSSRRRSAVVSATASLRAPCDAATRSTPRRSPHSANSCFRRELSSWSRWTSTDTPGRRTGRSCRSSEARAAPRCHANGNNSRRPPGRCFGEAVAHRNPGLRKASGERPYGTAAGSRVAVHFRTVPLFTPAHRACHLSRTLRAIARFSHPFGVHLHASQTAS